MYSSHYYRCPQLKAQCSASHTQGFYIFVHLVNCNVKVFILRGWIYLYTAQASNRDSNQGYNTSTLVQ